MSLRTGFALVSAAGIPSGIATKQNNTVVWKDIMPNSLYKAYLCKEINLVGWFKTENKNRYVHCLAHNCSSGAVACATKSSLDSLQTKEKAAILGMSCYCLFPPAGVYTQLYMQRRVARL